MTIDHEHISRLLTKYIEELSDIGLQDHRWILYALGDIAEYCREHDMTSAGESIDTMINSLEAEILGTPEVGSLRH